MKIKIRRNSPTPASSELSARYPPRRVIKMTGEIRKIPMITRVIIEIHFFLEDKIGYIAIATVGMVNIKNAKK